ncbi:hypothetical protein ACFX5Q_34610, partial [Mesorhizobium sp. IMUNJ 23033]
VVFVRHGNSYQADFDPACYRQTVDKGSMHQRFPVQKTEVAIGCAVLNRMLACARPKSARRKAATA